MNINYERQLSFFKPGRLQAGINPAILSRNMGTGLDMIMHNYYHHHARGVADNITSGNPYDARANIEPGDDEWGIGLAHVRELIAIEHWHRVGANSA
ncbi:MAG: hypothetical protein ABIU05_13910 [Nitrospirales bacterium]